MRLLSFLAALALAALIVLYPRAVAEDASGVRHGALVLMMIGMSFSWVYGLGFVPQTRPLRLLFSPWTAWPLMGTGAWLVFGG